MWWWCCCVLSWLTKCEAARKIRGREHPVALLHLSLWEPLPGVSRHKLTSRLIVNQLGLGSCPVEGRWSCRVSDHGLYSIPPPSVVGVCAWLERSAESLMALLDSPCLLNLQHDPLNYFNGWVLKTSVCLCERLKCLCFRVYALSVGRCYTCA